MQCNSYGFESIDLLYWDGMMPSIKSYLFLLHGLNWNK